jgi:dephospho-CoA kinase
MKSKVIGLVGPMGSGKGTVGQILQKLGYKSYVLSDIIRKEADRRHLPRERGVLQDIGNDLRRQ